MIVNVEAWTAAMAGRPVDAQRDDRSLAALIDRHERSYAAFAAFARRVRDEQRLDDTFVAHFAERMTFGATILDVILPNAQHRSEALHLLDRLGVPDLPGDDPQDWEHEIRRTLEASTQRTSGPSSTTCA